MSVIGVDLGGTKSLAVRVVGREVAQRSLVTIDRGVATIDAILDAIARVADGTEAAIGVGIAGLVSVPDRTFVWGPHVSGHDLRVGDAVEERFGVPVVVDNDANTALFAELELGVARG
jgi:glucokinase